MSAPFLPFIKSLDVKAQYDKSDFMIDELLMYKEGKITIYYAPFDYINQGAKVVLLGITPGWTQMHRALSYMIEQSQIMSTEKILKNVKQVASFSGPLRHHLVAMLDEMRLNDYLGIKSCIGLFSEFNHLVHNTSILRYPVFINGKNYTGSHPSILGHPYFKQQIESLFVSEMNQLNEDAIIIPMGKAVSIALKTLENQGLIKQNHILYGFPHPSGANGHRFSQFASHKEEFIHKLGF
jgi:hypothetical protein